MKKEFVPFELAVKLKEIGFNEECIAYYDLRNDLEFYGADNLKDTHCVQLNTPLFQQAFRWFREKQFLIDVTSLNSDEYEFYIKWSFAYSLLSDIYKTYEEAELACLAKLIEIVETKKQEQ
jgi:hypothetical protein